MSPLWRGSPSNSPLSYVHSKSIFVFLFLIYTATALASANALSFLTVLPLTPTAHITSQSAIVIGIPLGKVINPPLECSML